MKESLLLTVFLLISCLCIQGQQNRKYTKYVVYGIVGNSLSHETLTGTKVELLSPDSVAIDSMITSANSAIGDLVAPWVVFIPEPGKYILRFSHNGYETKCLDFTYPANRSKRNLTIIHAPVYLKHVQKEKIVELNEVVVKATKVKFFYRGDTVVYNADDLLHQLSNVQRELNGQGRTETYYNVIPRYAMLHVIYRLNRQPKKK